MPAVDKNTVLKGIGYIGNTDFSGTDLVVVSVDDMGEGTGMVLRLFVDLFLFIYNVLPLC